MTSTPLHRLQDTSLGLLCDPGWRQLDLSGCPLTDAGAAAVAQRTRGLRALDVRGTRLSGTQRSSRTYALPLRQKRTPPPPTPPTNKHPHLY
jgi:hypothetical protein